MRIGGRFMVCVCVSYTLDTLLSVRSLPRCWRIHTKDVRRKCDCQWRWPLGAAPLSCATHSWHHKHIDALIETSAHPQACT